MVRITPFEFYSSWRFQLESPKGDKFGCQRVWSDPFEPHTLWIGRGHGVGRETVDEWLTHCGDSFTVRLRVSPESWEKDRVLRVSFGAWEWLPLDLDAQDSGVALEYVKLKEVTYQLEDGREPEE